MPVYILPDFSRTTEFIHFTMSLVFILFWGTLLTSASSETRPVQLTPRPNSNCSTAFKILPDFCIQHYTNVTFWPRVDNETIKEALEYVKMKVLNNITAGGALIERHLCYHYYPLCDTYTDNIIALCNGSCQMLNDNADYSVISEVADELVSFGIEPPDDKCLKTFSEQSGNILISQFCVRTEDEDASVEESIGVSCVPIPSDDPCSSKLTGIYYSPGVTEITESNFRNIITLFEAIEISESCESLTSALLCAYTFPPCDFNTSQLLPICPQRCELIDEIFGTCRQFVNNDTLQLIPVLRPLLETFNCTNPLTYYNAPPQYISDTLCSNLVDDNFLTLPRLVDDNDNSEDDNSLLASIIAGVLAGTIVILSIIIIIGIIIFKKVILAKPKRDHEQADSTMTSMSPSNSSHPQETYYMSNGDDQTVTMTSAEIDQFLQMVKQTFSDVLFPIEYITKQDFLGEGAFGVVHKGEFVDSDGSMMPIAIKTIKSSNLDSLRELVAETATMKNFNHPNVLQLLGVCVDINNNDSMLKVILPFMSNGDLRSFLRKNRVEQTDTQHFPKDIDKFGLIRMCIDIAKGMEYLSMKRFVHRDLAARNCMVDMHLNIRVADFGLTRDVYSTEYYRVDQRTKLPLKWMAMESILDGYFNEKTDMWSYGVTCWEVFSLGRIPYPGLENHNVITILKNGRRLTRPILCPPKLYNLIQLTWLENPAERPTFAEIVYKLNQCALF